MRHRISLPITASKVWANSSPTALVAAAAGSAVAVVLGFSVYSYTSSNSRSTQMEEATTEDIATPSFQIEVDFMDKLASKPYMSSVRLQGSTNNHATTRPEAVPETLRLLVVDVPEVARVGFRRGECTLQTHKIYPDGVVAPKRVPIVRNNKDHSQSHTNANDHSNGETRNKVKTSKNRTNEQQQQQYVLEVEQKAWVHSLYRCYHDNKVGVEIMQASTANLNPRHMKRDHPLLRTYVTTTTASRHRNTHNKSSNNNEESLSAQQQHEHNASNETTATVTTSSETKSSNRSEDRVVRQTNFSAEDEMEAPWNQHAWASELQLRIRGEVEFGASLEPACTSLLNLLVAKNVHYQTTVPSSRSLVEWLLMPVYSLWGKRVDPAGRDGYGDNNHHYAHSCWARHKPHAVIADGAALQRVPHAHRLLQKTCQEQNVPLYVIRDPRVVNWASAAASPSSSSTTIGDVLRDVRRTVKDRIVKSHLRQSASFQRGRYVGTWETDVQWRAASAIKNANDALKRRQEANRQRHEINWTHLDVPALEQKFIQHGLMTKKGFWSSNSNGTAKFTYSNAFQALVQKCNVEQQESPTSATTGQATITDPGSGSSTSTTTTTTTAAHQVDT